MLAWAVGVSLVLVLLLIWSAVYRGSVLASLQQEQPYRQAGPPSPEQMRNRETERADPERQRRDDVVDDGISRQADSPYPPAGGAEPVAEYTAAK